MEVAAAKDGEESSIHASHLRVVEVVESAAQDETAKDEDPWLTLGGLFGASVDETAKVEVEEEQDLQPSDTPRDRIKAWTLTLTLTLKCELKCSNENPSLMLITLDSTANHSLV